MADLFSSIQKGVKGLATGIQQGVASVPKKIEQVAKSPKLKEAAMQESIRKAKEDIARAEGSRQVQYEIDKQLFEREQARPSSMYRPDTVKEELRAPSVTQRPMGDIKTEEKRMREALILENERQRLRSKNPAYAAVGYDPIGAGIKAQVGKKMIASALGAALYPAEMAYGLAKQAVGAGDKVAEGIKKGSWEDVVVGGIEAGTGLAQIGLTAVGGPMMTVGGTLMEAAKPFPIVGDVARVVEWAGRGVAKGASNVLKAGINVLPVSERIKQSLGQAADVIAPVAVGAIGAKVGPKIGEFLGTKMVKPLAKIPAAREAFAKALTNKAVMYADPTGIVGPLGSAFSAAYKKAVEAKIPIGSNTLANAGKYMALKADIDALTTKREPLQGKALTKVNTELKAKQAELKTLAKEVTGLVNVADVIQPAFGFKMRDVDGNEYIPIKKISDDGYIVRNRLGEMKDAAGDVLVKRVGTGLDKLQAIPDPTQKGQKIMDVLQSKTMGEDIELPTTRIDVDRSRIVPTAVRTPQNRPVFRGDENVYKKEIADSIDDRVAKLIEDTAGYSIKPPTPKEIGMIRKALQAPGKLGHALWTENIRKLQDAAGRGLEKASGSQNTLVRNAAKLLYGFNREFTKSPETIQKGMEMTGGINASRSRAYDVADSIYNMIDRSEASLKRINNVLDPALVPAKEKKLSFDDLTPKEQRAYGFIRDGLDIVHDISYAKLGRISKEVYDKNLGKYTPRTYGEFELPKEVNDFINQSTTKLAEGLFKSRKDVDTWKQENNLADPVYGLAKRITEVETNRSIMEYGNWVAKQPRLISDTPKKGYRQLGDSPAYGALKGKYVLDSVADDFTGFQFANTGLNGIYDVLKWYDRLPIRKLQKKYLTVMNPTTHLGNAASDNVFSWMVGVDPITVNKNVAQLMANKRLRKQYEDYLTKSGIVGTDITRSELVDQMAKIKDLSIEDRTVMRKIADTFQKADTAITSAYGGTDDIYKMAALKSLLDKGASLKEASRLVNDGYQNYNKVGVFYDVASKIPVVGPAFIKFQGDLIRMIKNGIVNKPLHTVGLLMSFQAIADMTSRWSGETKEERDVREGRLGAPKIPGLNIPLAWNTPHGEINIARYLAPFYLVNSADSDGEARATISRVVPGGNIIDFAMGYLNDRDLASSLASTVQDPLLGPFLNIMLDRDFRGKRIRDQGETKYAPSTLTTEEKLLNVGKYLQRSYTPPLVNALEDAISNIQGKPDYYGKERNVPQALLRLGGIKVEQFGPEQAKKAMEKTAEFLLNKDEALKKNISQINNDFIEGKINKETRDKRIAQYKNDATFDVFKEADTNIAKKFQTMSKTPKTPGTPKTPKTLPSVSTARIISLQNMSSAIQKYHLKKTDDEIVQHITEKFGEEFTPQEIQFAINLAREKEKKKR